MQGHAVSINTRKVPPGAIFIKTTKGRDEIVRRSRELNARQRQVLILVDGVRQLHAINKMWPESEVIEIIDFLQQQDMIVAREALAAPSATTDDALIAPAQDAVAPGVSQDLAPPVAADTAAPSMPQLTADPAHIAALQYFLAHSARTYLGLLCADICRRIDGAQDAAQLLSVLGQWHMALRQSKHGGAYAERHLRQIEAGFYGGALPDLPAGSASDRVFLAAA